MVTSHQVQEFLDARRQASTDSETFQNARRALLASDKAKVLALFETRLQVRDEEDRASAIEGLALLYGREATDTIVRWINDSSPIVRSVACICLQDYGDSRVVARDEIATTAVSSKVFSLLLRTNRGGTAKVKHKS